MPLESETPSSAAIRTDRLWTLPNILCVVRLAGSFVLVGLAVADQSLAFLGLFLFLAMTDWVDGKLAIWLDQRTVFGARLDSVADAAMYSGLLFGSLWLKWGLALQELAWIAAAALSYALSSCAGLVKFGRIPSYHTRAAKITWFLITIAVISVFADWSPWPLRIALLATTLTNLEATLLTLYLREWRANVPSFWHAWRSSVKRRR